MAARSWATSISTAIGVAAGAAAAQLGIGYGLGIISWQPVNTNATTWVNSLAWVTWLAATSTVFGALFADRLSGTGRPAGPGLETPGARAVTVAWRLVIALAAAVGALITVPLVALPSRAPRPDNVAPYFTTGGYAVAGVIVGLVVALGALTAGAIAANVIASTAWLWTLGVVAVADAVRLGGDLAGSAQLATWQFTDAVWVRGMVNLPGALLMLAVALVIGVLAAWPSGRRGDNRVGVAISGAAGPLLVAAAYFLAAPGLSARDQHLSAFVMAPYAVLAGLAGSVLVSAIGPKGARAEARARRQSTDVDRNARSAAELTDWTQALAAADAADAATTPQPATPAALPGPRQTADTGSAGRAEHLDEDAYAPSRAYASDTVEPGIEPEPVSTGAAGTATGRAAVKEPLWPAQQTPATARPTKPTIKGKLRRGKSTGNTPPTN
jgi:hypothetical protein